MICIQLRRHVKDLGSLIFIPFIISDRRSSLLIKLTSPVMTWTIVVVWRRTWTRTRWMIIFQMFGVKVCHWKVWKQWLYKYKCRKYKGLTLSWNMAECRTELFLLLRLLFILTASIPLLAYCSFEKNVLQEQYFCSV